MVRRVIAILLAGFSATGVASLHAVYAASQEEQEEVLLGRPSTIRPAEAPLETIDLPAGTRLRSAPRRDAAVLEILEMALELPVLERRLDWIQVQLGAWRGWVEADPEGAWKRVTTAPVVPSADRIARARALLGDDIEAGQMGPFGLLTDVEDAEWLDRLDSLATDVVAVFEDRFGLDPAGSYPEIVVLFANEAPYRTYQQEEPGWAELHTQGYSRQGLAVLFVGGQRYLDLESILVHELAHLLNRRVFRADPPAWLDEGLAEDLAYCRIDRQGHLQLGSLGGTRQDGTDGAWLLSGARAHLVLLLDQWDNPERLALWQLTDLDRATFLDPDGRSLLYAESAFLIRSLLDSGDTELRNRFLEYLEQATASEVPEAVSLWATLEIEADAWEPQLYLFLRSQAAAHALPTELGRDP